MCNFRGLLTYNVNVILSGHALCPLVHLGMAPQNPARPQIWPARALPGRALTLGTPRPSQAASAPGLANIVALATVAGDRHSRPGLNISKRLNRLPALCCELSFCAPLNSPLTLAHFDAPTVRASVQPPSTAWRNGYLWIQTYPDLHDDSHASRSRSRSIFGLGVISSRS